MSATAPCGKCKAPVDFWRGARVEVGRTTLYVCSNECYRAIKREHEGMDHPPHCVTCRCVAPVRKKVTW